MYASKIFNFPWLWRWEKRSGDEVAKIVHEWNGHIEIFSLPQSIENYTQFLLLRTDIMQKTVVECP